MIEFLTNLDYFNQNRPIEIGQIGGKKLAMSSNIEKSDPKKFTGQCNSIGFITQGPWGKWPILNTLSNSQNLDGYCAQFFLL